MEKIDLKTKMVYNKKVGSVILWKMKETKLQNYFKMFYLYFH